MFNKQLKRNIKMIDEEIGEITLGLTQTEDEASIQVMVGRIEELTNIRNILSNNKVNESYAKEIISGTLALVGIGVVLAYEKEDIIRSTKAFSMAAKLFRG